MTPDVETVVQFSLFATAANQIGRQKLTGRGQPTLHSPAQRRLVAVRALKLTEFTARGGD